MSFKTTPLAKSLHRKSFCMSASKDFKYLAVPFLTKIKPNRRNCGCHCVLYLRFFGHHSPSTSAGLWIRSFGHVARHLLDSRYVHYMTPWERERKHLSHPQTHWLVMGKMCLGCSYDLFRSEALLKIIWSHDEGCVGLLRWFVHLLTGYAGRSAEPF